MGIFRRSFLARVHQLLDRPPMFRTSDFAITEQESKSVDVPTLNISYLDSDFAFAVFMHYSNDTISYRVAMSPGAEMHRESQWVETLENVLVEVSAWLERLDLDIRATPTVRLNQWRLDQVEEMLSALGVQVEVDGQFSAQEAKAAAARLDALGAVPSFCRREAGSFRSVSGEA